MRVLKFRVWIKPYYKFEKCKKKYKMIYPHLEYDWYIIDCKTQTLMEGEEGQISDYKMYIQQFTGLYDKNDKEIYEGDIVKGVFINLNNTPNKFIISDIFFSNDLQWQIRDKKFNCGIPLTWEGWLSIEVIGNIYENPELLE